VGLGVLWNAGEFLTTQKGELVLGLRGWYSNKLACADAMDQHDGLCRMNSELARRVAQLTLERCEVSQ
jgi:hypothetical protein